MSKKNDKNYKKNDEKKDKKFTEKRNDFRKTKSFDVRDADKVEGANDVSWYLKNPQLIKDTANLPFGQALGLDIQFDAQTDGSLRAVDAAAHTQLSGIMGLWYTPTYGISKDNVSAMNIAARNIYSYVRHANSGASNYDAPDLMLYLLAMDQIYSLHAEMTRAYGIARTYSGINRYLAKNLFNAIGYDYDDFIANMSNYRGQINTFALRMSSLYVPTTMSLFLRHMWMNKNVFTDSPNGKAQMYVFCPNGRYIYNEFEGAGKLEWATYGNKAQEPIKFQTLLNVANDALDVLLESEDIGIMSGDILKCYGESGLFSFGTIDENFTIVPVYNEEVLMQIHNATVLNCIQANLQNNDITQDVDNGALLYSPQFSTLTPGYDVSTVVDLYTKDTSPEMVTVATRFGVVAEHADWELVTPTFAPQGLQVARNTYNVVACGSEIICEAVMYTLEQGSLVRKLALGSNVGTLEEGWVSKGQFFTNPQYSEFIGDFTNFDWAPLARIWSIKAGESISSPDYVNPSCQYINDIDNYAILARNTLKTIHDVVWLSMFDVPITK